jgi:hypothetical protein
MVRLLGRKLDEDIYQDIYKTTVIENIFICSKDQDGKTSWSEIKWRYIS